MTFEQHRVDEESPLLTNRNVKTRKTTPLPKVQILVVLLLQICEPVTSQSIYPYINQLVSELDITGGDEKKVGYYAGLIESLFFATEALTVLQWSRASDHIGRKPVLMIGLAGSMISMLCFGLSRTFWALVISRCLTGLLNGNIGVMKSIMGDLTDQSNRAEGFALMPVVWSIGATLGPLMGGTFAKPAERWPKVFGSQFWKDYPYFLPCLLPSFYVLFGLLLTAVVFKETLKRKRPSSISRTRSSSTTDSSFSCTLNNETEDKPLPLRNLFIYPVVISISNYVVLAFLNIAFNALLPLFMSMPLKIGGLNLPPSMIGYIMGSYGAATGIFQFFFFSKIIRYLGERRVFLNGMMTFPILFALFPLMSLIAKNYGINFIIWMGIALIIVLGIFMDMAYGAIFMYITASAPNKRSLGATNGISQTSVSIARAIGPAMSTSLFSLSVQENWLGGYAVFAFFGCLSLLALLIAVRLPVDMWEEEEEIEEDEE
ncbi:MFS general substrate transporter [Dendrothele bispora CBS 962.96]|uniref:MFS general substrate transporter n=1 Tax=Dendrothele bispora (strain CBS 962.96) TaxID=1314807 RepID=A0A4S8L3V1_DENBC|nr:MFS general substrate transporter [Dendrothele bispora CBS 962.96]